MSYSEVIERINSAAKGAGREPYAITLVAVSKTKSVSEILAVYEQGHRDFGENRAQELAEKAPQLPNDIRWHFVGHLQSNKARTVRSVTSLLHSMDRESLASAWLKGKGKPAPVLIQVNVDREPQKSGVLPEDTAALIDRVRYLGLVVNGLMAIPRVPETPGGSRGAFTKLRDLRDQLAPTNPSLTELSMGMTDDYEVAIGEGASFIRVGRAIFGDRKSTGD